MRRLKERVAYLRGLTKGMAVDERSVEGRLLVNIIEVLEEIAEEFHVVQDAQDELVEYVEALDEDLTELEGEVYEDVLDVDTEVLAMECGDCDDGIRAVRSHPGI